MSGKMSAPEITEKLRQAGYYANEKISTAMYVAQLTEQPLLISGAPGVGKSSLPAAWAKANQIPLIRISMYDGLTDDRILYDYDYQKQLLVLESIKPVLAKELEGKSLAEAIQQTSNLNFYGQRFLIQRPILRSIMMPGRKVLLIDEIDKATEEIEYMLYEFLESFSLTIPQFGTIACEEEDKPTVFVTSNDYRPLSKAFRRRCAYLYIGQKTEAELVEIILAKTGVDPHIARFVAGCLADMVQAQMAQTPSLAEAINYAVYLLRSGADSKESAVAGGIATLAKDQRDLDTVKGILVRRFQQQEGN